MQDNSVTEGSIVAFFEDTASFEDDVNGRYHVGLVTAITDDLITIHYMGTGSKKLCSAKWKFVYHEHNDAQYRRYKLHYSDNLPGYTKLTATIDNKPIEDSLILLPNVGINEHAQMSRDTRAILGEFTQKHHVHKVTWDHIEDTNT